MMKTINYLLGLFLLIVFYSCAKGIDAESFDRGVSNAQLDSPDPNTFVVTSQTNADGTESCVVEWKQVNGACGYLCKVENVDDPSNPIPLYIKGKAQEGDGLTFIDGCRIIFTKSEDTKYLISVQSVGDATLNNKDALEPTLFNYSTMLSAIMVPEGQEISSFINSYIKEHYDEMLADYKADSANYELAFELVGGKTYELNDSLGFGIFAVTFRGDKVSRPIVNVGEKGFITNMSGLKVKWINFDCTNMKKKGLICMDKNGYEGFTTEALGYKALGANQNCYVVVRTMMMQECFFKNLQNGLLYGNEDGVSWNIKDFRINDCIVQQCNSTGQSNSLLNMWRQSGGQGGIKDITLKNTTFINTEKSNGYIMRFAHNSSTLPQKIYGSGQGAVATFDHCTFIQTTTGGNFVNMYPNNANQMTIRFKGNVFYDTWRIQKMIQSNFADFSVSDNTIWGITNEVDNSDKEKYATMEDPLFVDPTIKELDLNDEKGGYNFMPTSEIAGGKQYGDPRWFE